MSAVTATARRVAARFQGTGRPGALGPSPVVLVVDDDDTARRFLVRAVRRGRMQVLEARSGAEALQLIDEHVPDVVLLDSQMPEMSGGEVLAALRAGPRTATLPVILVTGRGDVDERVAGLEAGADDFLTKPVHPDELLARVRAQLRGRAAWIDAIEQRWLARNEVVEALGSVNAEGTATETAAAICRELGRLGDYSFAAILAIAATEVTPLATLDVADRTLEPAVPLPRRLERAIREHARAGPWSEPAVAPWVGTEVGTRADASVACFAPIHCGETLVGVVVLGAERHPAGRATAGPAATLATAIDVAAISGSLLGPRLVAGDPTASRRAELAHLIEIGAFAPVFQPVVRLEDRAIVGFEALTRFADGSAPETRFGDAAALGLAHELERATLARALSASYLLPAHRWLSVNASASLVRELATLTDLLAPMHRPIVLELTERERVDDYESLRAALGRLGTDVRLAVDDTGAGYASLRHILSLAPAFIKLDMSWVRGLDDDPARQALIAGMHHFADRTGSVLVAEGVETDAEAATLLELGVDLAQGFLFGRPAPVEHWG